MTYLLRATESGEILDRDGKVVGRVVPVNERPRPVMQFNPYTGTPRHPADIASDPAGLLVWDGEEPILSAATLDIAALAVEVPERYENVTNLGGFRAGFNAALDALEGK